MAYKLRFEVPAEVGSGQETSNHSLRVELPNAHCCLNPTQTAELTRALMQMFRVPAKE